MAISYIEGTYEKEKYVGQINGQSSLCKETESYWIVHKNYFETKIIHGKMRVMVHSFEEWFKNQCE